jgi:hypothetical protein
MAKTLIKLYDDEVDLEEYILVDEEDVERIKEILEDYRSADPEYNIDAFLEQLETNGIEYETPPVEKVYF